MLLSDMAAEREVFFLDCYCETQSVCQRSQQASNSSSPPTLSYSAGFWGIRLHLIQVCVVSIFKVFGWLARGPPVESQTLSHFIVSVTYDALQLTHL